jgi:hypothetical protein
MEIAAGFSFHANCEIETAIDSSLIFLARMLLEKSI